MARRRMGTWVPVLADFLIGRDRRGNAHAVPYRLLAPLRGPHQAVCGTVAWVYAARAVDANGKKTGTIVMSWPPRLSLWAERERGQRCRTCFVETGHPAPNRNYDDLIPSESRNVDSAQGSKP